MPHLPHDSPHTPAAPTQLAPLNIFQYLARQWERVHPYNAAQVIEVASVPDISQLNAAWTDTLATLGLGRVKLTPSGHFGFEVLNGEMKDYPVRVLPAGTSLEEHLSREINRKFEDPGEPPFRLFVLPCEDSFHLGVVYQHWTADSVSVQALLREIFLRVYDPSKARQQPARLQDTGYWGMYGPRHGRWKFDENLCGLTRRYFRYRRVRKVDSQGLTDPAVHFAIGHTAPNLAPRLRLASRAAGVKVHDVLVAALIESCAEHIPSQYRKRRRDLAVGSIIDLRPLTRSNVTDVFGMYLGFTGIIVHEQDLHDWPRLLKSVAIQNRHHKDLGIPQTSLAWMLAARLISHYVPPTKLWHFYRKEMPLMGGLSNLNLSNSWAAEYSPTLIRDYIRVSPTGPIAPLAIATTSFGGELSVGMTYRKSLIDETLATRFLATFTQRLAKFADERSL